jgi:hypothetical protein
MEFGLALSIFMAFWKTAIWFAARRGASSTFEILEIVLE